jgi:hypothetical protein
MSEEDRVEYFCHRKKLMNLSAWSLRKIWSEGESNEFLHPHRGKKPKLSDHDVNEIFSDACVRTDAGVSFSPRTLKERIIKAAHGNCMKNKVDLPTRRSIDNYISLLKSIGLKFVPKPQLRDLRQYINRSSYRNACTTYSIAVATHAGVSELLIINIDPTTVIFGYADKTFCVAVVPIGTEITACLVGHKAHSLPHSVKILPMASLAGTVGPMVLLYKVSKLLNDSDLVKVRLYGCHPSGAVGPFRTYLWFYDTKPLAEICKEYYTEFIPLFLHECRKELHSLGQEEERAVLWIDCGDDVSKFFTTPAGVKWAEDHNLCVNMHAAKYTGVAQQFDQSNAFRGLCLFLFMCLIFFL